MEKLMFAEILICFFLTGLIWVIQLVHYPTFKYIAHERFHEFSIFHGERISFIVVPAMISEALLGGYFLFYSNFSELRIATSLLIVFIWLVTFSLSVPCHQKLASGFDELVLDRLIKTNWFRTIGWTLRSLLLLGLINGKI